MCGYGPWSRSHGPLLGRDRHGSIHLRQWRPGEGDPGEPPGKRQHVKDAVPSPCLAKKAHSTIAGTFRARWHPGERIHPGTNLAQTLSGVTCPDEGSANQPRLPEFRHRKCRGGPSPEAGSVVLSLFRQPRYAGRIVSRIATAPDAPPAHTNHLASEQSPYLLQHAHNPVDWHPWGDAAFARARAADRPIFLSIGYSTCHWCHVMERESFADEAIGRLLNEHFVAIKLDREERPDIDRIYMSFVQATTGAGGWPLNVFLTPALEPMFGGTYFPPESRHGRPSFRQVLERVAALWKTRRTELVESARDITSQLRGMGAHDPGNAYPAGERELHGAGQTFLSEYDARTAASAAPQNFPPQPTPVPPALRAPFWCERSRRGGAAHLPGHGGGRPVRPAWRRVRPLLGG